MRTLIVLSLWTTAIFFSCTIPAANGTQSSSFTTAIEYNDYIIERQSGIINHILLISKTAESDMDATEALLDIGVKLVDSVLLEVNELGDFDGDSTFRNTAVSMFGFYRNIFDVDYREMVAINKKGAAMTEADVQRLQDIQARLSAEETERDKHFHHAQQEFAEKNHLKLAQNALQEQIDGDK